MVSPSRFCRDRSDAVVEVGRLNADGAETRSKVNQRVPDVDGCAVLGDTSADAWMVDRSTVVVWEMEPPW